MEEKDYYSILGVNPGSNTEDIKQAFRREALKCHPDRNPGDKKSEERFKLISEAYAVLTDPIKRPQYDRSCRAGPGPRPGYGSETAFNQEEILREFFSSARSRQVFKDLAREFKRLGLRLDEKFMNRLFSGSGKWFAGGFFFMGSFSSRTKQNSPFSSVFGQSFTTDKLKQRQPLGLGRLVTGLVSGLKGLAAKALPVADYDINYNLTVTEEQANAGTKVKVAYERDGSLHTVTVTIPPGTKDKTRLRMKGMGHERPAGGRGNLFLNVRLSA